MLCVVTGAYLLWVNGPEQVVATTQAAVPAPPMVWQWPAPWASPPEVAAPPATPVPLSPAPAAPTAPPAIAPSTTRDLSPVPAGADFFALGVEDLGSGWLRLREAGNRDYCAWSNIFKLEVSPDVAVQIPHCLEWRMTGTGYLSVTFKPDPIGYSTSDTLGTGLAWWPSGNNGDYRVSRGGQSIEWVPLSTGPEGVNFPINGGEVTIQFRLTNGYVQMPLGEVRNNVLPVY